MLDVYTSDILARSNIGPEAITWKGTHASNALNILNGTVGRRFGWDVPRLQRYESATATAQSETPGCVRP